MSAVFFLLIAVFVVMLVILGWSIIVGWILTQIFAFTLFEGTLLGMLASGMAGYFIFSALLDRLTDAADSLTEWSNEDEEEDNIPAERFFPTPAQRTWEAWFRFQVANTIYAELRENLPTATMDKPQKQELSIRLSEICIAALKDKSPKANTLHLTIHDLQGQMTTMELKPYDDDLLNVAAEATNLSLILPPAETVIREKMWNQIMPTADLY
ncbi:MAG: hypothetical protein K8I82_32565 [Anaerolineae bacterium]|nr:hypothetical protein [Anaerolineae bacterium]